MNGPAVHCSTPVIHCAVVVDRQFSAWSGQYQGDVSDEEDIHDEAEADEDGIISLHLCLLITILSFRLL